MSRAPRHREEQLVRRSSTSEGGSDEAIQSAAYLPRSGLLRCAMKVSGSERSGVHRTRMARVRISCGLLQRRCEIFFTLALEFLLGGFEARHARGDFFAFRRKHVLLFGHACPFDSCPASMVVANGARMRRLSCRIVVALDRSSRTGVRSIEGSTGVNKIEPACQRNRTWQLMAVDKFAPSLLRARLGPNVGACRRCGGIDLAIRLAVL